MKAKVYIETSVVSYYTARPSRDVVVAGHQRSTEEFWNRLGTDFEPFVSALVWKEVGKGDPSQAERRIDSIRSFSSIEIDEVSQRLAQKVLDAGGVPTEFPEDALHIALATMGGVDFLVTWNFTHINNPFTRMMIRHAVENEGYVCPEIVSPEEMIGERE